MKRVLDHHVLLLGSICLIALLVGCANGEPSAELPSKTKTLEPATAVAFSATSLPEPTAFIQVSPEKVGPTAAETVQATVLPTLTRVDQKRTIFENLQGDDRCQLPCWWGIQPGETQWDLAERQFLYWGTKIADVPLKDGAVLHGLGFQFFDEDVSQYLDFLENDGLIERITVETEAFNNPINFQEWWHRYSPREILERYGVPDQVFVSVLSTNIEIGEITYYDLWLVYDQQGFYIKYSGVAEGDSTIHICPQFENADNIFSLKIDMQAVGSAPSITQNVGGDREIDGLHKRSIEEAAGIGPDEFYHIMLEEGQTGCFDTPLALWER